MGKRVTHKRQRNWGGRTKEQGVPAALAAVRSKTSFANLPKCSVEGCNQVRAYGTDKCRIHGAAASAARRKDFDYVEPPHAVARKVMHKTIKAAPIELKRNPKYQSATLEIKARLVSAYNQRGSNFSAWLDALQLLET